MKDKKKIKVKICGITRLEEITVINELLPDYIGMVIDCENSKRSISLQQAMEILKILDSRVMAVAVVVAPTLERITEIQKAGFQIIQVHQEVSNEVLDVSTLPIWKAYHISKGEVLLGQHPNITGYVLDSVTPGSGKVFDWEKVLELERRGRLLVLAGGLHSGNIEDAIFLLNPDVVDVSTGVEREDGNGKDIEKIKKFIEKVRAYE